MKNLWLSNLLLLTILASCSGHRKLPCDGSEKASIPKTYFNKTTTTAKYKADISIFGKHLSGILLIKFLNDTTCNSVFLTVPGLKLFDLRLTPDSCHVNSCIAQLNKPGVLATIEKNIRIFTMLDNYSDSMVCMKEGSYKGVIWRRNTFAGLYDVYQSTEGNIDRIEYFTKKMRKKIVLTATDFDLTLPNTVNIRNKRIHLFIHLSQL